jgi:hypothetical protein
MHTRISALLAILALSLTAALLAGAGSASAQSGPDGGGGDGPTVPSGSGIPDPCPEFTMEPTNCGMDGGGGGGGGGDHIPIVTRKQIAVSRASLALSSRPACFRALTPENNRVDPRFDPSTVLRTVPVDVVQELPGKPRALASVRGEDVGRGTGALNIRVHPPFSYVTYSQTYFDFLAVRLTREVTFEDMQVLAILHEVGHLTGVHPAEATLGLPPLGFPQDASQQVGQVFNTKILVHCLGAAEYVG